MRILLLIYILLWSSTYGYDCGSLYLTKSFGPKLVLYKLESMVSLTEGQKRFLSTFGPSDQLLLKDILKVASTENITKAFQLMQLKPQLFTRHGGTSKIKLMAEMVHPGHAYTSYQRSKKFKFLTINHSWEMPNFRPGSIITVKDKKYHQAINQIRDFLDNEKLVYQHMQDLEDEVITRVRIYYPDFTQKSPLEQARIKEVQLEKVLSQTEIRHGFLSATDVGYAPLELSQKTYSDKQWYELLREGKIFNDTNFDIPLKGGVIGHGYYTHRIQWHILMKNMDLNPNKFYNFKGVDLYKKFGDEQFLQKLGFNRVINDDLWLHIFDSFADTYHRPEYFRQMHIHFPDLGLWR